MLEDFFAVAITPKYKPRPPSAFSILNTSIWPDDIVRFMNINDISTAELRGLYAEAVFNQGPSSTAACAFRRELNRRHSRGSVLDKVAPSDFRRSHPTDVPPDGNYAIDIHNETLVRLAQAGRHVPPPVGPVSPATIYRWVKRGIRGIRLEAVQIGGTKCTTLREIAIFAERLSRRGDDPDRTCQSPEKTTPSISRAVKTLDSFLS